MSPPTTSRIPPNIQISSLKLRLIVIGILSILAPLAVIYANNWVAVFNLVVIWMLIIASIGGLKTLNNMIYGKFNYKDQRDLK